ncbi:712_t:CDS:2, partial [Gigaspora rosea]
SEIHKVSKDANALKIASPKFSQIEQALEMWISTAEQRQLTLTGEVIRQKALEFAKLLGVLEDEFKASEETESAPIEFLPQFHKELKDLLKLYKPQNIFNAINVVYFIAWNLIPYCQLLCTRVKKNKLRITVICMSNADGTENMRPLVINKSKMPFAFHHEGIISH